MDARFALPLLAVAGLLSTGCDDGSTISLNRSALTQAHAEEARLFGGVPPRNNVRAREPHVGLVEVARRPTLLSFVEPDFYVNTYPDLVLMGLTPFDATTGRDTLDELSDHFLTHGIREGRTAQPTFDVNDYLARYPDVNGAVGGDREQALLHWLRHGMREGRVGSEIFDAKYYLERYPDLKQAFGSNYAAAHDHWLRYGIYEGRGASSTFDVNAYLNRYPDLRSASIPVFVHQPLRVIHSVAVPVPFIVYQTCESTIHACRMWALTHWLRFGKSEGRNARP